MQIPFCGISNGHGSESQLFSTTPAIFSFMAAAFYNRVNYCCLLGALLTCANPLYG
jgi:hypothetical protein